MNDTQHDTRHDSRHDTRVAQGRHPVSVGHLVMGLAFLCITVVWALIQSDAVTGSDIRWLLPVPWLVAGAAGLVAITVGGLRRPAPTTQQSGWVGTTTGTTTDTTTHSTPAPEEES